ncbi:MAG: bacteriohemerythrin [Treponema sp.]|nr:bacteriohemerythrin [Treponema sp.]
MKSKNELIVWSSTFACGIKLIDEQHKGLIELVNDMFNHVTGNEAQEREYLSRVLQKAADYIRQHFTTEEKILTATKFAGYTEHKKAHDNFILKVAENAVLFNSGKRVSLTSFSNYLKDWVMSHIAVMDKQYFQYIREIATRKADGSLSIPHADIE